MRIDYFVNSVCKWPIILYMTPKRAVFIDNMVFSLHFSDLKIQAIMKISLFIHFSMEDASSHLISVHLWHFKNQHSWESLLSYIFQWKKHRFIACMCTISSKSAVFIHFSVIWAILRIKIHENHWFHTIFNEKSIVSLPACVQFNRNQLFLFISVWFEPFYEQTFFFLFFHTVF